MVPTPPPRLGRWIATAAAAFALTAVFAQPAAAFERVLDGGFDLATCTPSDCVSPAWTESTSGAGAIGPICQSGSGPGTCADGSGTGYNTAPRWARLGAGINATTGVAQTVQIPAAPAQLTFLLHITAGSSGTDTLSVTIDGTEVFRATDATAGFNPYKAVTLDVSRFAGGARVLRFQAQNTASANPSDSFDVDEVSLDAPEPAPPPDRDLDRDGFVGSQFGGPDCNDSSPAIHPGGNDVPHDGIDQDCALGDAPYPTLDGALSISVGYSPRFSRASKRYTVITSLRLRDAPVGSRVSMACAPKGEGCPFKSKSVSVRSTRPLQLARYVRNAKLRRDAALTVRVTKPGYIGLFVRYTIRLNHLPGKTTRCLQPGATAPRKTCS
jgi:Putative metal-binding motif